MDVFIVRPFGTKEVLRKAANGLREQVSFDFERVQSELIDPVLKDLQLNGGTTGRIFASGEIRTDMFSELLLADLVIADISIHNANGEELTIEAPIPKDIAACIAQMRKAAPKDGTNQ